MSTLPLMALGNSIGWYLFMSHTSRFASRIQNRRPPFAAVEYEPAEGVHGLIILAFEPSKTADLSVRRLCKLTGNAPNVVHTGSEGSSAHIILSEHHAAHTIIEFAQMHQNVQVELLDERSPTVGCERIVAALSQVLRQTIKQ